MKFLERVALGVRTLVGGVRTRNPFDTTGPVARQVADAQAQVDSIRKEAERVAARAAQAETRWREAEAAGSPHVREFQRAYEDSAKFADQLKNTYLSLQKVLDKTNARLGIKGQAAAGAAAPAQTPPAVIEQTQPQPSAQAEQAPAPTEAEQAIAAEDLSVRMQRLSDPNDPARPAPR